MKRIAQLCAGFSPGDAISDEALAIRSVLADEGHSCEIYAWPEHIHPAARRVCLPATEFRSNDVDLLIYHFSIGSPLTRRVIDFPGRKAVIYHNVTPGHFFEPYSPKIARQLEAGRAELAQLRDTFDVALADSEFNRQELEALAYTNTHVLPILFDPSRLEGKVQRRALPFLKEDLTTLLFVGRLVPNKKAENLVRIFDLYQKYYNPRSRLIWAGPWGELHHYKRELEKMVEALRVRDVVFTGYLSNAQLAQCYRGCDVFACASEHEGFCVPVLEAFHFGKPVVAMASGAIPETVAEAGLLFEQGEWRAFAEGLHRVVSDHALSAQLVARARERLRTQYGHEQVRGLLLQYLKPLLETAQTPGGA